MGYEEAFTALGYSLSNVRQNWSAEKPDGVCVTIWKMHVKNNDRKLPSYDGFKIWPHLANERDPAHGNTKLIEHLSSAVDKFGGRVDAIYLAGNPDDGRGHLDADPWYAEKRGGFWRVTKFDRHTGLYRADVFRTGE